MLGVGDIVAGVANARADGAHADTVDHLASVTVVPVNKNISMHLGLSLIDSNYFI